MRSIRHQKWKNVDLLLAQNIKKTGTEISFIMFA